MIGTVKTKTLAYVCMANVGFAMFLYAILSDEAIRASHTTFGFLLAGGGLMYGAFLYAAFSIWLPLRPWIARYHKIQSWQSWILHELPTLMALIPVLIGALRVFKASWNEIKSYQEKGELNVQSLAGVAQKFAQEAEKVSHEPAVEKLKSRIQDAA